MKTEEKVYEIDLKESTQLNGNVGTLEELKRGVVNEDYYIFEIDDDERPYLIYSDEEDMQSDTDGRKAVGCIRKVE